MGPPLPRSPRHLRPISSSHRQPSFVLCSSPCPNDLSHTGAARHEHFGHNLSSPGRRTTQSVSSSSLARRRRDHEWDLRRDCFALTPRIPSQYHWRTNLPTDYPSASRYVHHASPHCPTLISNPLPSS